MKLIKNNLFYNLVLPNLHLKLVFFFYYLSKKLLSFSFLISHSIKITFRLSEPFLYKMIFNIIIYKISSDKRKVIIIKTC